MGKRVVLSMALVAVVTGCHVRVFSAGAPAGTPSLAPLMNSPTPMRALLRPALNGLVVVNVGEERALDPLVGTHDGWPLPGRLEWSTSDPAILDINQHTARGRGKAPGNVVLTATDPSRGNMTVQIPVMVEANGSLRAIKVLPARLTLAAGEQATLMAEVTLKDGQVNSQVIWSSSDEAIARVDAATGEVTPTRPGRVTIVAAYRGDPKYRALADLTVVPAGRPEPAEAPGPSGQPTAAPSPGAGAASPLPSPGASSMPGAEAGLFYAVGGQVVDENGQPLQHVVLRAEVSTKPRQTFETRSDAEGRYAFEKIPVDVALSVYAFPPGGPLRARSAKLGKEKAGTTLPLHFGRVDAQDPIGAGYFIPVHPEAGPFWIEEQDGGLLIHVSLSQPFDGENTRRIVEALRVFPADAASAGGLPGTLPPWNFFQMDATSYRPDQAPYVLKDGSQSPTHPDVRVKTTWSAYSQYIDVLVPRALLPAAATAHNVYVGLVVPPDRKAIVDVHGRALGLGPTGKFGEYGEPGTLIRSAIYTNGWATRNGETDREWPYRATTLEEKWIATHRAADD